MKPSLAILVGLLSLLQPVLGQEKKTVGAAAEGEYYSFSSADGLSMQEAVKAVSKQGVHWCALPMVGFNQQTGLTGRIAGTLYDFGSRQRYPNYDQMLYGEASYSTRRAGCFRLYYDTKRLVKGFKLDFDIAYQPDALWDFYGYNGYQAKYNPYLINPFFNDNFYLHDNPAYTNSAFYRMKRNLFRFAAEIRGKINDTVGIYWHAGAGARHYAAGRVDYGAYNRGKASFDQLADTVTLFDLYRQWGLIEEAEAAGGWHPYLRAGVSIDRRDREINPQRGFYGDLFFTGTLGCGPLSDYSNVKANFNWKHHVELWREVVNLAYMAGGQLLIAGDSPFYMNGAIDQLLTQRDMFDGTGNANLPRGMLRNRVLGKGFGYASVELHVNVFKFRVKRDLMVVSLNPFVDQLMILQPYDLEGADKAEASASHFCRDKSPYIPHVTAGLGARLSVGTDFAVSLDWAAPLNEQDNDRLTNFYLSVGYLF